MSKPQLAEKMQALQLSKAHETDLQEVLHELEVYQIELEMQNRQLQESQKAQAELLERYVSLYDFAPTGYLTLNAIGMIKDLNLTMSKMLGVDRNTIMDRALTPWILPADLPIFRSHVQKCRTSETPVTTELRMQRRDKTVVFVELTATRTAEASDLENHFRTSVTDISARKNAESERDRFFDLSLDLLSLIGTDGYFKRINAPWVSALGYSQQEFFAHPFLDFVHPDDRDKVARRLSNVEVALDEPHFEARFMKKDRSLIWLSWKSTLANGVYYSVARDVTHEQQEKLNSQNDQNWLRELVEAIPAPMALVEAQSGNIVSMSTGGYELAATEPFNEMPLTCPEGFALESPKGRVLRGKEWPRMRAAGGEELNGEEVVWKTPNKKTHLRIFSRNIPSKYGRPAMAIILSQDVSILKNTEESLLQVVAKLNQERDMREKFVSTLTHDLRTPLCAVKMGSQLIVKSSDDPDIVQILGSGVLENVDRLDDMISDLLDANRINAGEKLPLKKTHCDLVALVKKTLDTLNAIHGKRFVLTGDDSVFTEVDAHLIRRMLENLCTNAVKYGNPSGDVTLNVQCLSNHIQISVHNDGPEISKVDQSTIFNPFQRTASAQKSKKKGWGIGLTLVRGIAESHGGQALLVSDKRQGTIFTIKLPRNGRG